MIFRYFEIFHQNYQKFFFFLVFLELHPWHMEITRLEVESELQLPVYTTATATQDPRSICDLHHSSGQCQISQPTEREAWDQTCVLTDTSWIHFRCAAMGTLDFSVFLDRRRCKNWVHKTFS